MSKMPPWSHSLLTNFETCPKQYYHQKVLKDVKPSYGAAAKKGQEDHKKLEERLKNGRPLPIDLNKCEKICQDLLNSQGELMVEAKIGLDENLNATSFFGKKVWARGVLDVGVFKDDKAFILDWKTGKQKSDNDQLEMFAWFTFMSRPWVNTVSTAFVWIPADATDRETFTREKDVARLTEHILHRVDRVKQAHEKDVFVAKPNGLCKKYCPVTSCEHNGE